MTSILIILLIIWLIVIQNKLFELSKSLKEIKKSLVIKNSVQQEPATPKSDEPVSISDIPDDIIWSAKKEILPKEQPDTNDYLTNLNKQKKSSDLEKIFLGNIFNKIGALALLIGIIIFIKLLSPFIIFTPEIKITLGFFTGIGMIAGALKLHSKENLKNYSEVLLGTGFGALFITTYCASTLFHLFNMPVTLAAATALFLASFYLADKLKTVSMLAISLVAGYLNPFFINPDANVSPNFLMGYLIFVNLISLVYTYKNKSKNTINSVNLWMTLLIALIYFKGNNITAPAILWSAHFVYDLVNNNKENSLENKGLNLTNFAVFTILSASVYWNNYNALALTELAIGLLYMAAAFAKKSDTKNLKLYVQLFLASTLIAVYFAADETPITKVFFWSIESVILSYAAYKYKFKALSNWAVGTWAAAAVSIIPIDNVIIAKKIAEFTPFWNIRLAMFTPTVLSAAASSYLLSKSEDKKNQDLSKMFEFEYISLIYLYLGFEANDIINKYLVGNNTSPEFIKNMIYSILGFVYTINFKKLYNSTNFLFFNMISAIIGVCSLIFLMFTGMHYQPANAFIPVINIRFTAFLAAIGAFCLYSRWTKNEVYKYIAVFLGFILIHIETGDSITRYHLINSEYLTSLSWTLYSGIITAIGIFRNIKVLKHSGIGLLILAILRIFIYDLANVDILYKFIAFLTLGSILMALSYFYNKFEK